MDTEISVILIQATFAAMIIAVGLLWLFNDENVPPALADESLHPKAPKKTRPDNRLGATRVLLEAYLAELRGLYGEAELVKRMPVMVAYAYLPSWMSTTITLDKPVGGWLLRYTGGESATAVAPDGTQMRLDARTQAVKASNKTVLAIVRIAGGEGQLIHVRGKGHPSRSHYRAVGIGRFRRYVRTTPRDPDRRTIYSEYLSLEGA